MPALITHRLFGEQALSDDAISAELLRAIPDLAAAAAGGAQEDEGADAARSDDARDAFLIANQGPDPLFFGFTSTRAPVCHDVATRMHHEHEGAALAAMRDAGRLLPPQDRQVGLAFAAGQLAHYALDRTAHPFVYAQQYELERADEQLRSAPHELHALIESDIDGAMLLRLRGVTTLDYPPARALSCSERAARVGGELLAQAAFEREGVDLRPADYPRCLDDMVTCYRVIEPAGGGASRVLGALERRIRSHSELQALAHRVDAEADCPAMNPHGNPWLSPTTGELSCARFDELFDQALALFGRIVGPYLAGADVAALAEGFDYSGAPLRGTRDAGEGDGADEPERGFGGQLMDDGSEAGA